MSALLVEKIAELTERQERRVHSTLGDVEVDANGRHVKITDSEGNDQQFEFDEVVERAFAKHLDVNPSYLSKCPNELKALNLNHWLSTNADAQALFMVGPKGIETMHDPDDTVITIPEVAKVISRVFDPKDEIVTLHSDPDKFHADIVIQNSSITVAGNGVGDRPDANGNLYVRPSEEGQEGQTKPNVFDITHGGIRILAHPSKPTAPTVERYFNRYICSNGLTMPVADKRITLRGQTVEEVLDDMERIANELMEDMDEALERYASLSEVAIPGNPLNFIRQIGREHGIPSKLIQQALDYAGASNLGHREVATSYDVLNIFTSLANNNTVRYSTANKLQALGGLFVHKGEDIAHRCETCERTLV